MKSAWVVLIISAVTDFLITSGATIQASMFSKNPAGELVLSMPSEAAIWVALIAGMVVGARTIQQKLSTTVATIADLKGLPQPEVTKHGDTLVTKIAAPLDPKTEAKTDAPDDAEELKKLIAEAHLITTELKKTLRVDPVKVSELTKK